MLLELGGEFGDFLAKLLVCPRQAGGPFVDSPLEFPGPRIRLVQRLLKRLEVIPARAMRLQPPRWRGLWRKLRRDKGAMIGLSLVLLVVGTGVSLRSRRAYEPGSEAEARSGASG